MSKGERSVLELEQALTGDALAEDRAATLRALVDLRLQLELDRVAAAEAVAERDALKARCSQLEKSNSKLQYQVKHLVRNLDAEEVARAQEAAAAGKKQAKLEYQVKHLIRSLEAEEANNA